MIGRTVREVHVRGQCQQKQPKLSSKYGEQAVVVIQHVVVVVLQVVQQELMQKRR